MLSNSGLEKDFWAEAVNTACYLVNRSPSTAIECKTPNEVWSDDMLIAANNMSHIQVLKRQLSDEFEMKDLGAAKKILGMEIRRDRKVGKLYLLQKSYIEKGRHNERVVPMPSSDGACIILNLDGDPPAQWNKVSLPHLFISGLKCLKVGVVIDMLFLVVSRSVAPKSSSVTHAKEAGSNSTVLHFGDVGFKREFIKTAPSVSSPELVDSDISGAIFCDNEAVPAFCGIRAIWVTPSNRRKHIATQLLDAARKVGSHCQSQYLL
ncbi:hypothetical protein NE237_004160 [Protea cynaroides]|uniref:Uncharacterized protein n=1 Tax=Protea cynaroides TaxID=273540 RepID=A0A9Q0KIW4_9MAGN|nr:hypothetical protein NE237_004160 [Protea cynaroides]